MVRLLAQLLCLCGLLSSLLASCRSSSPWNLDRVESGNAAFNSTKLIFPASDAIYGIDIEFLHTSKDLYVYLNVHSTPVPPLKDDPKHAHVVLTVGSEKHHFVALRREGGQRLLLSKETVNLLIESLQKDLPIEIRVSGYSTQLTTADFSKKFQKMQQAPLFPNPFHLPF